MQEVFRWRSLALVVPLIILSDMWGISSRVGAIRDPTRSMPPRHRFDQNAHPETARVLTADDRLIESSLHN